MLVDPSFDGTHNLNYTQVHNPPLVFNVETDPQETYPVNLAKNLMDMIEKQKAALTFQPNAINPAFGMKWALCCDVSTNCTCKKKCQFIKFKTLKKVSYEFERKLRIFRTPAAARRFVITPTWQPNSKILIGGTGVL